MIVCTVARRAGRFSSASGSRSKALVSAALLLPPVAQRKEPPASTRGGHAFESRPGDVCPDSVIFVKVALCVTCTDFVTPLRSWTTDRTWRWCQCHETGVRWRDGARGLLEVTSLHGRGGVRVLGLSNLFLQIAVTDPPARAEWWRELHTACADAVEPSYLFHAERRGCWACLVRVGESSDITFIDYGQAMADSSPAGSTDRAAAS